MTSPLNLPWPPSPPNASDLSTWTCQSLVQWPYSKPKVIRARPNASCPPTEPQAAWSAGSECPVPQTSLSHSPRPGHVLTGKTETRCTWKLGHKGRSLPVLPKHRDASPESRVNRMTGHTLTHTGALLSPWESSQHKRPNALRHSSGA